MTRFGNAVRLTCIIMQHNAMSPSNAIGFIYIICKGMQRNADGTPNAYKCIYDSMHMLQNALQMYLNASYANAIEMSQVIMH